VYQVYYVNELGMSNSSVAWIGSFQLWIQYALGLGVGRLFDEGYGRQLIIGGSILYALS
jgi:MCP family monocarboxylic acid transporter-like MFS transporter 10